MAIWEVQIIAWWNSYLPKKCMLNMIHTKMISIVFVYAHTHRQLNQWTKRTTISAVMLVLRRISKDFNRLLKTFVYFFLWWVVTLKAVCLFAKHCTIIITIRTNVLMHMRSHCGLCTNMSFIFDAQIKLNVIPNHKISINIRMRIRYTCTICIYSSSV